MNISKKEAASIILDHFNNKTLCMFAPEPRRRYYDLQDGVVYRCAIGCLFTEAEAKALENSRDYYLAAGLMAQGILKVNDEDAKFFREVQDLHDNACVDAPDPSTVKAFEDFVRANL